MEDYIKTRAKNLPEGWYWIKYDDNSGHLESPDGKRYMMYDLDSDEFCFKYEDGWSSIREGYDCPKNELDPFELMEEEMLFLHKDIVFGTNKENIKYEI